MIVPFLVCLAHTHTHPPTDDKRLKIREFLSLHQMLLTLCTFHPFHTHTWNKLIKKCENHNIGIRIDLKNNTWQFIQKCNGKKSAIFHNFDIYNFELWNICTCYTYILICWYLFDLKWLSIFTFMYKFTQLFQHIFDIIGFDTWHAHHVHHFDEIYIY